MVSVKDVAAAAGVSVGTVSNVLNQPDKVAADTVTRVQAAIAELGFVRNDAARQLRAGRSRTVGLIVLDASNPFFAEVARGAEARAAKDGLSVLLGNSDEQPEREATYVDLFREQRVNGVLASPTTNDLGAFAQLRDAGVPVVLVDRHVAETEFPSVAVDDVEGGRLAAEHLIDQGRRRLAFIAGPLSVRQVHDRLEGMQKAADAHADVTVEVLERGGLTVLHGREAGQMLVHRPAHERPDGIFAANDLLAVGVLQALSIMSRVRVPEDIALVGYDDIDFAAAAVVPLTSIRQPAWQIGYRAVDLLLQEISSQTGHERAVRFQPELVVRSSTRSSESVTTRSI